MMWRVCVRVYKWTCASSINVALGSTSSHEMTGDYIGSFNWEHAHTRCLWRPSAPFTRQTKTCPQWSGSQLGGHSNRSLVLLC